MNKIMKNKELRKRYFVDRQLMNYGVISHEIRKENDRQLKKFGVQMNSLADWMLFLNEEVGELSKEILENNKQNTKEEAIQVATLAVKIAEMVYDII